MRSRRAKHNGRREAQELNITAFMNLMVVLTPFLLITAVFSRLAILELSVPTGQSGGASSEAPLLQLEIIVRESAIEVGDRGSGVTSRWEKQGDAYPLEELSAHLVSLKEQFPEKADATLLLEPQISYQTVVAVMDRIRVAERVDPQTRRLTRSELFPEISIGDAPLL
jgi:biopolymer transport protein ExbD